MNKDNKVLNEYAKRNRDKAIAAALDGYSWNNPFRFRDAVRKSNLGFIE